MVFFKYFERKSEDEGWSENFEFDAAQSAQFLLLVLAL